MTSNTNEETTVAMVLASKRNGAVEAIVRIVESVMGGSDVTDHVQAEIASVVESLADDMDEGTRIDERHRLRDMLAAEARELRCVDVDDPACAARCRTAAGYDEAAQRLVEHVELDTRFPAPLYCVEEFDDGWSAFLCDHGTGTEGLPSREAAVEETHRLFRAAFGSATATVRDMEARKWEAKLDKELAERDRLVDVIDRVKEILGIEAEWTNCYGHKQFLQDLGEVVAAHERIEEEASRLAFCVKLYDQDEHAMRERIASMRDLLRRVVSGEPFTDAEVDAAMAEFESPSLRTPKDPT